MNTFFFKWGLLQWSWLMISEDEHNFLQTVTAATILTDDSWRQTHFFFKQSLLHHTWKQQFLQKTFTFIISVSFILNFKQNTVKAKWTTPRKKFQKIYHMTQNKVLNWFQLDYLFGLYFYLEHSFFTNWHNKDWINYQMPAATEILAPTGQQNCLWLTKNVKGENFHWKWVKICCPAERFNHVPISHWWVFVFQRNTSFKQSRHPIFRKLILQSRWFEVWVIAGMRRTTEDTFPLTTFTKTEENGSMHVELCRKYLWYSSVLVERPLAEHPK